MPIDPTLYPSIPQPQEKLLQRLAQMEMRLTAIERKRDISITPWAITVTAADSYFESMTFPYYGGRLWFVSGGGLLFSTTAVSVFAHVGINVANSSSSAHITHNPGIYISGQTVGLDLQTLQVSNPYVGYLSPPNLVLGDNTLSAYIMPASQPGVTNFHSSGLIIEWPQA